MKDMKKSKLKKQKGAASILTVFFIGLGIATAFYGASSLLKGFQEASLTNRTLMNSQNLAWKSQKIISDYLNKVYCGSGNICEKNLSALQSISGPINITGLEGVTASVEENTVSSNGLMSINIQARTGGSVVNVKSVQTIHGNLNNSSYTTQYAMVVGGNTTINGNVGVIGENSHVNKGLAVKGNASFNGAQNIDSITATGNVSLANNSIVKEISANGDINTNGAYSIDYLIAGGNFNSDGSGQSTGVVGGTSNIPEDKTTSNNIETSQSVPAFDLSIPVLNSYTYRNDANYVFDLNNGVPSVYVKNIRNISDGWYPIGGENKTATNIVVMENICKMSPALNCIVYNNGLWTIRNEGINSGIVWINGNATLNGSVGSKYINSFIVTGNIQNNGNTEIKAFNFATGIEACEPLYSPTDYCLNNNQTDNSIGNISILSGGYNASGSWTGGNISLSNNGLTKGQLIAGTSLSTSNNTNVEGAIIVSAVNLSTLEQPLNMAGNINIDISSLNNDNMKLLTTGSMTTEGVQAKWVRYN